MRVFLIHGMGRSRASMALLSARLRRAGHDVSTFGYAVSRHTIDDIGERFLEHIARGRAPARQKSGQPVYNPAPYAVVGHSLGNIITRHICSRLPAGFSRFIMLAPPNSSPAMARALRQNPVFRVLTKDGGQKLADPAFYETLPIPDLPTLIIAGDKGPRLRFLPFKDEHDGLVALREARLEGIPLHVVPALHTFIMNHSQVVRAIHHFLERGEALDELTGPRDQAA